MTFLTRGSPENVVVTAKLGIALFSGRLDLGLDSYNEEKRGALS
jgi:hypothetical protein